MITKKDVSLALAYMKKFGDTDIFPQPFEYDLITENEINWILGQNPITWRSAQVIKCLKSKTSMHGFRSVTMLDPIDSLFYLGLVISKGVDLERRRLPKDYSAIFSYRFLKDQTESRIFDKSVTYHQFRDRGIELASKYGYMVEADISDFFSRIYVHDVGRSVCDITDDSYERVVENFLMSINTHETIGLPTGPHASNYLAELVLNDLDRLLLSRGIVFCRYVDNILVFGKTKEESYKNMFILADFLDRRYHLSLQASKTRILSTSKYLNIMSTTSEAAMAVDVAIHKSEVIETWVESVSEYDLGSPEEVYEELSEEEKTEIDSIHFHELLQGLVEEDKPDFQRVRTILRLARGSRYTGILELLKDHFDLLLPVVVDIMKYLQSISPQLDDNEAKLVKEALLHLLLKSPDIAYMPFYKIWLLDTLMFYDSHISLEETYEIISSFEYQDAHTKRYMMLILGKLKCQYWFRDKKGEFLSYNNWQKRAFIKGMSDCEFTKPELNAFKKYIEGSIAERDAYILKLIS